MEINTIVSFEQLLDTSSGNDLKIVFWEDAADPIQSFVDVKDTPAVQRVFAVLGPEGGFTPEEIDKARKSGFITASLGPRILRAETAAIAASALLQHLFGDMG